MTIAASDVSLKVQFAMVEFEEDRATKSVVPVPEIAVLGPKKQATM